MFMSFFRRIYIHMRYAIALTNKKKKANRIDHRKTFFQVQYFYYHTILFHNQAVYYTNKHKTNMAFFL